MKADMYVTSNIIRSGDTVQRLRKIGNHKDKNFFENLELMQRG